MERVFNLKLRYDKEFLEESRHRRSQKGPESPVPLEPTPHLGDWGRLCDSV